MGNSATVRLPSSPMRRATSVEHARHHIISRAQASVRHPARHQVIVISARPHHRVGLLLLTQACRAEGEGQLRQARLQVRHRLMRAPRHCSSATRAASYSGVCFKMPIHLLVHINATDFMDDPWVQPRVAPSRYGCRLCLYHCVLQTSHPLWSWKCGLHRQRVLENLLRVANSC